MPISSPVSQKLIQWQAGVLKEVTGLAEWLKWSSRTALIRRDSRGKSPASARHAIDETHQSSELPGDGQQQRSPSPAAPAAAAVHSILQLLLLLLIIASVCCCSKSSLFPSSSRVMIKSNAGSTVLDVGAAACSAWSLCCHKSAVSVTTGSRAASQPILGPDRVRPPSGPGPTLVWWGSVVLELPDKL